MLRADAGLGLLIGPPGTGKSLLCQVLAELLRDPFEVVLLAETAPRDQLSLLQNILFHLNMPYKNLSEGELRLSLIDRLTQNVHTRSHGLVLIVDEAQSLPTSILEEIRMITNIVRGGRSCVRTVLVGNHELEERLAQPGLESLAQRVAVRCYLHPFAQADTVHYLRAILAAVEDSPRIDDEAAAAIHFATGGVPRLIHQLMRQVLATTSDGTIDVEQVNRVWSQTRQLASPVLEPELQPPSECLAGESQTDECQASSNNHGILEFGELSCDAAEEPQAAEESAAAEEPVAEPTNLEEPLAAEKPPAPTAPIVADTMPEIAAELDRVTDSLLRISDQQYDESDALEDTWDLEDVPGLQAQSTAPAAPENETAEHETAEHDAAVEPASLTTDDTQVFDTTVQWSVEETVEATVETESEPFQPLSVLVEPATLFGDGFDEEETVPGPQASVLPITGDDLPAGNDVAPQVHAEQPFDAELQVDAEPQDDRYQDDGCQPEHDLHSEVACISVEASTIQWTNELPPPSPAIGTDGVGQGESFKDDICLNDDSDMLIIEDVVDIEPAPVHRIEFDDDPTDSVDYQRLFNRMRQG